MRSVNLLCALVLVITLNPAWCNSVVITNAGFESPVVAEGTETSTIDGWTVLTPAVRIINPPYVSLGVPAPEGDNVLLLKAGIVSQNLAPALSADVTYTFSFLVAADSFGYEGTLLAGVTPLISLSGGSTSPYALRSGQYTANASDPLLGQTLSIQLTGGGGGVILDSFAFYDDIRLDATSSVVNPVPEPSTLWLSGLLIAGLIAHRYRH